MMLLLLPVGKRWPETESCVEQGHQNEDHYSCSRWHSHCLPSRWNRQRYL